MKGNFDKLVRRVARICRVNILGWAIEAQVELADNAFGWVNFSRRTIEICSDQSRKELLDTIIHELAHIDSGLVHHTEAFYKWKRKLRQRYNRGLK